MLRNNADARRCSYFELGLPVHTAAISDLCEKNYMSNLHVIRYVIEWVDNLNFFSYDVLLSIANLWFPSMSFDSIKPRNANNIFSLVVCLGSTLFPRPDRSVSLGRNLMRFAVILQHAI